MRWSLPIGRLFGIPIKAHATLLLLLVGLGLFAADSRHQLVFGGVVVALLFGSVLVHELGHALVARRYGIGTREIVLLPIGGVARLEDMPRFARHELWIALAGPLTSLGLAALFGALFFAFGHPMLRHGAIMNAILGGFNLLPAFPLDGGRILRAGLSGHFGALRATRYAAAVGRVLAVGLLVGAVVIPDVMLGAIAIFVWFAAGAEERSGVARALLDDRLASDLMEPVGPSFPATAAPADVLAALRDDDTRRAVPVTFGDRIMGVVHREPLMSATAAGFEPHFLHQILDRNIVTARSDASLREILGIMGRGQSRAAVLMAADDAVAGILLLDTLMDRIRGATGRKPAISDGV